MSNGLRWWLVKGRDGKGNSGRDDPTEERGWGWWDGGPTKGSFSYATRLFPPTPLHLSSLLLHLPHSPFPRH